jgi:hypothetical protein
MAAYCRICNDSAMSPKVDTYVSCNNCGSFACAKHYAWWGGSRNAFCTECFPKQASQAVSAAAAALQAVVRSRRAEGVEEIDSALRRIANDLAGLSIEDLIQLLQAISAELERRNRPPAA